MPVRLHPHAEERAAERGATRDEIVATVETGETFPAKHGRTGRRRTFPGPWTWRDRTFDTKQVIAYVAGTPDDPLVITVIVRFQGERA